MSVNSQRIALAIHFMSNAMRFNLTRESKG